MERGDVASVKAANHPAAVSGPPVPGGFELPDRPGLSNKRRWETLMDARISQEMKIIIFSVKFDKFTGFFDKFPKMIFLVTDCNQKICTKNMSVMH